MEDKGPQKQINKSTLSLKARRPGFTLAGQFMSSIVNKTPTYYPDVDEGRRETKDAITFVLETVIRKEYKGIWYDILIKSDHGMNKAEGYIDLVNVFRERNMINFRYEVYAHLTLFKLDDKTLTLRNTANQLLYTPSVDQRSEEERMKEFMNPNIKRTKST